MVIRNSTPNPFGGRGRIEIVRGFFLRASRGAKPLGLDWRRALPERAIGGRTANRGRRGHRLRQKIVLKALKPKNPEF